MGPTSPLSNERHDVYINPGNTSQRSNSLTSFTSFTSTSNMSTISTASHSVPRGNSTNDLLFMESRFTRPSRMKNPQLKQAGLGVGRPSLTSQTTSPSAGYIIPPRSSPRASSVPSIPQHASRRSSIQSIHQSPLSSQQQNRPSIPIQHSFNGFPMSPSMNQLPSYRRSSLKSQPYHTNINNINNIQQFNGPHHQLHSHPHSQSQSHSHSNQRRHSNRPGFHNAPFTFPNGEVYTPRNKQRNSQTSLKNLHKLQTSKSLQNGLPSPSSPSLTDSPQSSQPLSFSASSNSVPRVRLPQQPQLSTHVSPPPNIKTPPPQVQTQNRTQSQAQAHQQQQGSISSSDNQDLSLLTTGSNSYSSSPSPSRTSRTNSSVNESTPPSSIDDLTIHTTTSKNDLQQLPPPLQHLDFNSSNNLDKIQEHTVSDHETKTNVSTPTSDTTQKTLQLHKNGENLESGHSSKETLGVNHEKIDSKQPDYENVQRTEEVEKPEEKVELQSQSQKERQFESQPQPQQQHQQQPQPQHQQQQQPSPSPPIVERSPAPELKFQTLSQTQIKSSPAKPFTIKTPIISHKPSLQSFSSKKSSDAERKPSMLKRIFTKVFSSDKKKKSLKKKNESVENIKTPHFISPIQEQKQEEPKQEVPKIQTPSVNDRVPKESSAPKAVDNSDNFSFMDGDEDGGLKVESDSQESDESSDFKSELVLDKLFSKLSTNESSEEVFKKLNDEKAVKKRKADDQSVANDVVTTKDITKTKDSVNANGTEEDDIIQFDDMELIDKMIEYGETPFPNLAESDLGQSQRKLQRSKSIERKKSLRSISSSSRQLDEVLSENSDTFNLKHSSNLQVIYSNQPKDPFPSIQSRPSILKRKSGNSSINRSPSGKKVGFTNQIFVNSTYPSYLYNRHSRSLSSYSLSPQLIQQIRYELNDFKRSMTIHDSSRGNTHFFRA